MADRARGLMRVPRGIATVARRRGLGYFGYLVRGVALPTAAYRFVWGPSAPPVAQGIFAAASELTGRAPEDTELTLLGLTAALGPVTPAARVNPDEVEQLLDRAHAAGITGVAKSFRRLVRAPDGSLRFGDLSAARKYRIGSVSFAATRDADRRAFNEVFGASLLTEDSARALLRHLKARVPPGYREYAPIDFGAGLTVGRIVSTDSGTGRWEFFNRHVVAPLVTGRRVLDLGSNNGSMPLMMLRAGAREVVAIEYTPAIADFARLNAQILSWRDIRRYNIQVLTGDMRLFLSEDFGRFDVVTAFCSLYYLPEEDMRAIVRKAASMDATLILQANEAIESNLPGRTLDLHRLMRENGYPDVAVHSPRGFARPLLVGRTRARAQTLDHVGVARR